MDIPKDFGRDALLLGKSAAGDVILSDTVVPGHITTIGVSSKLLVSLAKSDSWLVEYLA